MFTEGLVRTMILHATPRSRPRDRLQPLRVCFCRRPSKRHLGLRIPGRRCWCCCWCVHQKRDPADFHQRDDIVQRGCSERGASLRQNSRFVTEVCRRTSLRRLGGDHQYTNGTTLPLSAPFPHLPKSYSSSELNRYMCSSHTHAQ